MQIRVVRLSSRNPLVTFVVVAVVLALLALVLTAGVALLIGGAIVGTGGYLVRRIFGGRPVGLARGEWERLEIDGEEVFAPPDFAARDPQRLAGPPPEPPDTVSAP